MIELNVDGTTGYELKSSLPEVSVIVVTYNQELDKIIKTLESIVTQEQVEFEIIVCDDGSQDCLGKELQLFFSQKNFTQYKLVFHDCNEGTVSNYYSGLQEAKGKYSKLLSPGDSLVGKQTLYNWLQFMKESCAEWSFSDTFYCQSVGKKDFFIRAKAKPQLTKAYEKNDKARCMWNYLALRDTVNGASILGITDVQKRYCGMIKEKGIKYCEDYMYRLMVYHGIVGAYFPNEAVIYEYNTGISSLRDSIWKKKLAEDKNRMKCIMLNESVDSDIQAGIKKALIRNSKGNKMNTLLNKGNLFLRIKRRFFPRLTGMPDEERQSINCTV